MTEDGNGAILDGRRASSSASAASTPSTAPRSTSRDGSITALIGPNGAGKTTLFNVLTGFYKGDRGAVTLRRRRDRRRPAARDRRARGWSAPSRSPRRWRAMPVIDNMMLAAPDQPGETPRNVVFRPRPWRRARGGGPRAGDGAARGLQPARKLADDYAGTLSGGQRKLLELARALMAQPRLLLLDEPMAGINPTLGQAAARPHAAAAQRGGRDLPLHRARHGGGDEPLRPGGRDGRGAGDRRRRAARGAQGQGGDRRLPRRGRARAPPAADAGASDGERERRAARRPRAWSPATCPRSTSSAASRSGSRRGRDRHRDRPQRRRQVDPDQDDLRAARARAAGTVQSARARTSPACSRTRSRGGE